MLRGLNIGFAITGSFCTINSIVPAIEDFIKEGANVYPIISQSVDNFDTRFGKADDLKNTLKSITGKEVIKSVIEAEPIGPKAYLDALVVAPCTGNTLAKIANAITDTPVTMAAKAHLRNGRPLIIAISTNDGLGNSAKNIGTLLNMKNIYIVPFGQDAPLSKPNSIISDMLLILPAVTEALQGKQMQPILI